MRMTDADRRAVTQRIRSLITRSKFKWDSRDTSQVKLFKSIERLYWERINRERILQNSIDRYREELRRRYEQPQKQRNAMQWRIDQLESILTGFTKKCDRLSATLMAHNIPLPEDDT